MGGNPIVHWEVMGPDGNAQREFYAGLFDWSFQEVESFPGYHLASTGEGNVGGAVGQGSEEIPAYVTVYVQVASINDVLAQVEAAGGSTVMPRTVIPDTVITALFADPAGNMIGLVEEAPTQAE